MKGWIDDAGALLHGPHRGELVTDLASTHPTYLRWVHDTCEELSDDERTTIEVALAQSLGVEES